MAEGKDERRDARAMVVQPGAVEKHISSIFGKLDLPASEDDHRRGARVSAQPVTKLCAQRSKEQ